MKFRVVYKCLPAFIFYTDNLPDGVGGRANGPVIRIRNKYKGVDEGIHQHELTHVKQWYRTILTHGLLYVMFELYRLNSEVEAYKKQLEYSVNREKDLDRFAGYIAERYDLPFPKSNIIKLLND